MNPFARYPRRAAAALGGALLLVAACTDRSPVTPDGGTGGQPPVEPGRPIHLVAVSCTVNVKEGTARCDDAPNPDGPATDLILGGQNRYVNLDLGPVHYDHTSELYELNVTVRNLIQQALGTTNGVATDPNGVRVFLQAGPNVTVGTGNVTLINPDGRGTFTASNQPYFQYNQVLDQFEMSAARTWRFQMPPTVTAFGFTAYVSAAVQFPDGWVDVSAEPITMHPHAQLKLSAIARDAAGNFVEGAQQFTWSSLDSMVAAVTPSGAAGGMVTSLRGGVTSIKVTASNASATREGLAQITVTGMQRIWQGDVSTNYHERSNWERDIVPVAVDTIIVPFPSPNYPGLVQNTQIGGVEVADGARLDLNAFDLTASRNVVSSPTGGTGITGTTGRLFLTGTGYTVRGRVPRLRVSATGVYSLSGSLWATAPLQVDGGRLTTVGYRIESNNNQ